MKRIQHPHIILFGFAVMLTLPLSSQEDKQLPVDQIEVIKAFDARLVEADKLPFLAKLPAPDTVVKQKEYSVSSPALTINYGTPSLRPLALHPEALPAVYDGYLRAGYGAPNALLLAGGYEFSDVETYLIRVSAEHIAANKKMYDHQRYASTDIQLEGSWYDASGMVQVDPELRYRLNERYYYGYDHADSNAVFDHYKQRFTYFDFKTEIRNPERLDGNFNYSGSLWFAHTSDLFDARENSFILDLAGEKLISGRHPLKAEIIADFTTFQNPTTYPLHNFYFNPSFTLTGETYRFQIGGKIASNDDQFYIFPNITGSIELASKRIVAFADFEGSFIKNSLRKLSIYNPWINSPPDTIRNTKWLSLSGGMEGHVSGFYYSASVTYRVNEALALFLPSQEDQRKFNVLFDDGNVVSFEATVHGQPAKGLDVGATLVKHVYDMDTEERAWHLPSLEFNLFSSFRTLEDKLTLNGSISVATGVAIRSDEGEPDRLNNLIDVSLGGEYYFMRNLAGFIKINNLLSNKYERWENYPTFGTMIMVGLTLRI